MRKFFFVISVVGSVFFMTACGLNEEENITPSIDEMVVAPAATDKADEVGETLDKAKNKIEKTKKKLDEAARD